MACTCIGPTHPTLIYHWYILEHQKSRSHIIEYIMQTLQQPLAS